MATGLDLVNAIRAEQTVPPAGIRTLGLDRTHHWITELEPGRVELVWEVDPAYLNLEGAVICVWTTALADQALFLAGTSLCGEGEGTRMADLHLTCVEDMREGPIHITASISERVGDRMFGRCDFTDAAGNLRARVTAILDVRS